MLTAASVLLCGCASSNEVPYADRSEVSLAALSLWKDFPAGSSPRPLVLAGPEIIDPTSGFRNGDDKLAYINGQFTVASTLPDNVPTWHHQPLITAAQALADLRNTEPGTPPTSASLTITAARLGTATFVTDRGEQSLPAWQFSFAGVRDLASVLAIAPANRWPKTPRPAADTNDLAAGIGPSGDITIKFIGGSADPGPCQTNYTADTVQSDSAVLVAIRELPGSDTATQPADAGDPPLACNAIGYPRSVTVKLDPTLAGRVLIDSYGAPLPIRRTP